MKYPQGALRKIAMLLATSGKHSVQSCSFWLLTYFCGASPFLHCTCVSSQRSDL